ncbi:hypothetical protein BC826DRAFT_1174428 [Russula brevipes]|nr:hypothetical protein BC826DRAFT_1174428 [Russula brevipes]
MSATRGAFIWVKATAWRRSADNSAAVDHARPMARQGPGQARVNVQAHLRGGEASTVRGLDRDKAIHDGEYMRQTKYKRRPNALSEQNRDEVVTAPSKAGRGARRFLDPERTLVPEPTHATERQRTKSAEDQDADAMVIEDSDSEDSSGIGSDLDTVAPYSTHHETYFELSSPLSTPIIPARHSKQRNRYEGGFAASSENVEESMATIAECKKALRSRLGEVHQTRRRLEEEQRRGGQGVQLQQAQQQVEREERYLGEGFAAVRREYQLLVEKFRLDNPEIFAGQEESESEFGDDGTPTETPDRESAFSSPSQVFSRTSSPHVMVPSNLGLHTPEDSRRRQQGRMLHRDHAEQAAIRASQQDNAAASSATDNSFVVVARRVRKLGPCGTVVINQETGKDMVETKRYRVRVDDLQSIDGDGDSEMGDR